MKKTAPFLAAGVLGVASLLLGQAIDFYLHAADPTLAHREGLFNVTNPGHVLLGLGLVLVVVGVLGAAYTYFPLGSWGRRAFLTGFLALAIVSGITAGWAASIELSAQQRLLNSEHRQATTDAHQQLPSSGAHQNPAATDGHAASMAPVTAAQLQAATSLYQDTKAAVQKYRDLKAAIRAGYQPMEPTDLEIVHYINWQYMTQADILKPQHVQSLIYYNGAHGPILIGAMYLMPSWGSPGPQIGGALTSWHHHDGLCVDKQSRLVVAAQGSAFFDKESWSRSCPPGTTKWDTPDMLHVWLIDNPNGPFDSDMDPADVATILGNRPAS
jgi:hypothetical protein